MSVDEFLANDEGLGNAVRLDLYGVMDADAPLTAVAQECFPHLTAPVLRLTAPDAPVPFGALERAYLPSADAVAAAVRSVL